MILLPMQRDKRHCKNCSRRGGEGEGKRMETLRDVYLTTKHRLSVSSKKGQGKIVQAKMSKNEGAIKKWKMNDILKKIKKKSQKSL